MIFWTHKAIIVRLKKTKGLMGENWHEHMLQKSEKGLERMTKQILQ